MRKVNSVIGQDVVSLADGHRMASVKDVVIDAGHESVLALVIQESGLLSDARIIPIGGIHGYGRDAIVIEGDESVVEGDTEPDIPNESRLTLAGMTVFSTAGERVGTIADVYFEEGDGRIVGFELSGGVVDDIASGRRFLPVDELDHVGDDIVYVRPEGVDSLAPLPGGSAGVMGAMADIRSKVEDVAQDAGDEMSEMRSQEGDEPSPTEADQPTPGSDLVGRRSGADVAGPDGRILVANGQVILAEHVERANVSGQADQLRTAADTWSAGERDRVISRTVEQITDTAGSVWDRFTKKLSELTDESGKRMSEQQTKARLAAINDAVGRPVTKVILDRSDEVILNLGDIITHEAVQRAYDAGILDTLLASVYKGEVAFDRDEMRAPTEGTSTVEKASGGAVVVEELQTTVDSAEAERTAAADQKRRDADEARELRELERQERAEARDEASRRAAAGEPYEAARDDDASSEGDDPSAEGTSGGRQES